MVFAVDLYFYDELKEKDGLNHLFVCADDLPGVVEQVSGWYGENNINSINIEIFSPDNMLIFKSGEDEELFFDVKDNLGEEVIW